jgi:hypothetical protein
MLSEKQLQVTIRFRYSKMTQIIGSWRFSANSSATNTPQIKKKRFITQNNLSPLQQWQTSSKRKQFAPWRIVVILLPNFSLRPNAHILVLHLTKESYPT